MRALAALTTDVRIQARQGFWGVFAVVGVTYVALLWSLPVDLRDVFLPFVVFSDPAFLGFYVVAGAVLLERNDRTLDALFVTPLRPWEYLAAKAVSLTLIAVVTALAIAVGVRGLAFRPELLVVGVGLTSTFAVGLGIGAVCWFSRLNRFLVVSGLFVAPLAVPLVGLFGVDGAWLYAFPTHGSLLLIGGAFAEMPPPAWQSAVAVLLLVVANALVWPWAHRRLVHHLVREVGT